jgi:hypothetical protein
VAQTVERWAWSRADVELEMMQLQDELQQRLEQDLQQQQRRPEQDLQQQQHRRLEQDLQQQQRLEQQRPVSQGPGPGSWRWSFDGSDWAVPLERHAGGDIWTARDQDQGHEDAGFRSADDHMHFAVVQLAGPGRQGQEQGQEQEQEQEQDGNDM